MTKNTMKIALCGVTGALIIVILLMGFMFPFATYACPAIAACILFPIAYEYKEKTAFTLYVATSFLALMLVPDQELVFMYVFVFGFYTIVKFPIDKLKNKPIRLALKFIYINISVCLSYAILLFIFPVQALVNEFSEYGVAFIVMLMVMFNIMFMIYDKALEKILLLYIYKFRKRILKK